MCAHYQPTGTESSATISGYGGGQAWVQLRALRRQQAAVATLPSEGVGSGLLLSPLYRTRWERTA